MDSGNLGGLAPHTRTVAAGLAILAVLMTPPPASTTPLTLRTLTGESNLDYFGCAVAGVGDVNGDGYADVVVGARFNDSGGPNVGRAYVFLGSAISGDVPDVTLTGAPTDAGFGCAVAGVGDINGDGYEDWAVGADGVADDQGPGPVSLGRVYVYLGGPTPDAIADILLSGEALGDLFGFAVAGAGDINGDGYSDIVVGAPWCSDVRGRAYVYLGGPSPDNVPDLTITGAVGGMYGERLGYVVSGVGDVNGDGYSDIGIRVTSSIFPYPQRVEVYFGGASLDLAPDLTLPIGAGLFAAGSIAAAGDVNGDHYADIVAGTDGSAVIYYGGTSVDSQADVILTGDPNVGFGTSVAGAGDVNYDGYSDLIVGEPGAPGPGLARVFYGGPSLVTKAAVESDLTIPGESGDHYFGDRVAGAGDFDGDGLADVVVGDYSYGNRPFGSPYGTLPSNFPGRAYVLHFACLGFALNIHGRVTQEYWPEHPFESPALVPWKWGTVELVRPTSGLPTFVAASTVTDQNGDYCLFVSPQPGDYLRFALKGPYSYVVDCKGGPCPQTAEVHVEPVSGPNATVNYVWPAGPAANVFYHLNRVLREYWWERHGIGFTSPVTDELRKSPRQVVALVESPVDTGCALACSGVWDVRFPVKNEAAVYRYGTARSSDAIYHEVAHVMMQQMEWDNASPPFGTRQSGEGYTSCAIGPDGLCHTDPQLYDIREGLADYFAAAFNGDPSVVDEFICRSPVIGGCAVLGRRPYQLANADVSAAGTSCAAEAVNPNGREIISAALWGIRQEPTVGPVVADTMLVNGVERLIRTFPHAEFMTYEDFYEGVRAEANDIASQVDAAFGAHNIPRSLDPTRCPYAVEMRAERVRDGVRVSWDPVPGIAEWDLFRQGYSAANSLAEFTLVAAGVAGTEFVDRGAVAWMDYTYAVSASDSLGRVLAASVPVTLPRDSSATGVESAAPAAPSPRLVVHPNPAGEAVTVMLVGAGQGVGHLRVYNITGSLVRELAVGRTGGRDLVLEWDCRDRSGNHVSSGIYFLEASVSAKRLVRKVVIAR